MSFDCGDAPYQQEIAEWIKNSGPDCVLDELKNDPDLRVWIYTIGEEAIVGYGSLATKVWRFPTGSGKRRKTLEVPVILIPNVGMRREYHGQPENVLSKFDRYSSQIMDDLISKAADNQNGIRWLGLYVHPENEGAIKLYNRHDFFSVRNVWYDHPDFSIRYPAMLLDLDRIPVK
jgi:hypothetical protein